MYSTGSSTKVPFSPRETRERKEEDCHCQSRNGIMLGLGCKNGLSYTITENNQQEIWDIYIYIDR